MQVLVLVLPKPSATNQYIGSNHTLSDNACTEAQQSTEAQKLASAASSLNTTVISPFPKPSRNSG
jgi:hypothetical protein